MNIAENVRSTDGLANRWSMNDIYTSAAWCGCNGKRVMRLISWVGEIWWLHGRWTGGGLANVQNGRIDWSFIGNHVEVIFESLSCLLAFVSLRGACSPSNAQLSKYI